MALSNYKIKREFKVGEIVYIPTYGADLSIEDGTATQFTIVSINEGNTDKKTELVVTCIHHNETLKLLAPANMVYKVKPSAFCVHCGHEVCYESDKELLLKYEYYCPNCDENLYGIELTIN